MFGIVEFMLKDDFFKDLLIMEEVVVKFGIVSEGEVREMKEKIRKVVEILREFFFFEGFLVC